MTLCAPDPKGAQTHDRSPENVPISGVSASSRSLAMGDAEREHISSVLEMTGWQVRGKGGAAEILS